MIATLKPFIVTQRILMKHAHRFFMIIITLFFLVSCVSTGNVKLAAMSTKEMKGKLIFGKTTKSEVRDILGEASDIDFTENGEEKWVYFHRESKSKFINFVPIVNTFKSGTNDTTKKVVIVFDKNGIIKNHAVVSAKGETKAGLLG